MSTYAAKRLNFPKPAQEIMVESGTSFQSLNTCSETEVELSVSGMLATLLAIQECKIRSL